MPAFAQVEAHTSADAASQKKAPRNNHGVRD